MNGQLSMFDLPIWSDTPNATSSPASAAGASPCVSPAGPTIGPSGPDPAPARRSARPAKGSDALSVAARVICATLAEPDISSASLAAVIATPTSGTFGLSFPGSSASAALASSLAIRLPAAMEGCGSPLYRLTWRSQPMAWGPPICQLRASAHRTSDSGSGGELIGWPTPAAHEAGGTPEQFLARKEKARANGAQLGVSLTSLSLTAQMAGWVTPQANDATGARTPEQVAAIKERQPARASGGPPGCGSLKDQAPLTAGWSTPQARDGKGSRTGEDLYTHNARPLNEQVAMLVAGWSTPTAMDGSRGGQPPRPWDTGVPLSQQVAGRATPMSQDARVGTSMLTSQPVALSRQAASTTPGPTLSGFPAETEKPGQLNPAFSLWLQGYPPIWIACAPSKKPRKRR